MLTQAILAGYIMSVSQLVAAHCEADRLKSLGKSSVIYEKMSEVPGSIWQETSSGHGPTVIVVSSMPKPSKAWADAWAASMLSDPLFAGAEKREVAFGLTWAQRESNYRDDTIGDGGRSACSFQVSTYWGHTADELTKSPRLCVSMARTFMKKSFALEPAHPMMMYAGGNNAAARRISDVRGELVEKIVAVLPDLPAPAPAAVD